MHIESLLWLESADIDENHVIRRILHSWILLIESIARVILERYIEALSRFCER